MQGRLGLLGLTLVLVCASWPTAFGSHCAEGGEGNRDVACVMSLPRSPVGWFDLSGYYWPNPDISVGPYHLEYIRLGTPDEFAAWKANPTTALPPFSVLFDDLRSADDVDPITGPVHKLRFKVTPRSFSAHEGHVAFEGFDPRVGIVEFEGDVAVDAVYGQRVTPNLPPGTYGPSLVGRLRIGDLKLDHAGLNWFEGYAPK